MIGDGKRVSPSRLILRLRKGGTVHGSPGTGPLFGERTYFSDEPSTENMDLSPSRGARGTVPFSRQSGRFAPQRFARRENWDSPL